MSPLDAPRRRRHMRSGPAITVGALGGGGVTTLAVWVFGLFGIQVPAEVAGPLGSLLSCVLAYVLNGGNQS